MEVLLIVFLACRRGAAVLSAAIFLAYVIYFYIDVPKAKKDFRFYPCPSVQVDHTANNRPIPTPFKNPRLSDRLPGTQFSRKAWAVR